MRGEPSGARQHAPGARGEGRLVGDDDEAGAAPAVEVQHQFVDLVGGLAVGMIQSLSSLVLPIQLQNLVLFVIFILVLAIRPEGLLKRGR